MAIAVKAASQDLEVQPALPGVAEGGTRLGVAVDLFHLRVDVQEHQLVRAGPGSP
ncbi:hypothetical protein ACIQOU_35315 [Streptomyces sp. NPDC091279]|uniref:hypothetical protein n=1 Tax=unclassified Streptomyces TaxID=2593676 RepID=UPI0037F6E0E8